VGDLLFQRHGQIMLLSQNGFSRLLDLGCRLLLLSLAEDTGLFNFASRSDFEDKLVVLLLELSLVFSISVLRFSYLRTINCPTHPCHTVILGLFAADIEVLVFEHFRGLAELPVLVALVVVVLLFEAAFSALLIGDRSSCLLVQDKRFRLVDFTEAGLFDGLGLFRFFTALRSLVPLRLNHAHATRSHLPSTHGVVVHLGSERIPPASAEFNAARGEGELISLCCFN